MPQWKMTIEIVVVLGIANHRGDTNRMTRTMMMEIMMRKMKTRMTM